MTLLEFEKTIDAPPVFIAAVKIGNIRLIDNLELE